MWTALVSLGVLFQAIAVQAIIRYECSDGGIRQKIQNAVEEAIEVATRARDVLSNNLNDDWVQAPLNLLFEASESGRAREVFDTISTMGASSLIVTIYCEENHLQWDGGLNSWTDRAYTYKYKNAQGREERGSLVYNMRERGGGSGQTPGAAQGGSSYATHGYRVTIPNAPAGQDVADCSDQAHIFIGKDRVNKQYPPEYDTRSFKTMVELGFPSDTPKLVILSTLMPLSHTALHELVHVAGGLVDGNANVGDMKITDGPQNNMYGLEDIVNANRQRRGGPGLPTTGFAQAFTFLAQALYVQVKNPENKPTYWTFGMIDHQTLKVPDEIADALRE